MEPPVALRRTMPNRGSVGQPVVLPPGPAVDSRAVPLHPGPVAVATTTTMVAAATEVGRPEEGCRRGSKVVAAVAAVATVVVMEVADTVAAAAEALRPGNSSRRLQGTATVVVSNSSSLRGPCLLLHLLLQAKTYPRRLLRVMSRLLHRRPRSGFKVFKLLEESPSL